MAQTSIELMIDLTKCGIGTVAIARGGSAASGPRRRRVRTRDAAGGTRYVDTVLTEILASIAAEDPLSVPLVLALFSGTTPQTVVLGGRKVNAATYQDRTLQRMVVTSFGFDIRDGAAGGCTYELQNRALAASTDVSDEMSDAAGTLQAVGARPNTIRIMQGATFTDDASTELDLPGIESFGLKARTQVTVRSSNREITDRVNLADIVDVSPSDWEITVSLTLKHQLVATALTLGQRLAALKRGTLALPCAVTGHDAGAAAPADKVITVNRLQFFNCRETLNGQKEAVAELEGDGTMFAADGTLQTWAQLLTMADAA